MGRDDIPEKGVNFSGDWFKGKKDRDGVEIPYAHGNARYTMRLSELENVDPEYNDPEGVVVHGVFYGGRDSDTNVPIAEALSWEHGVYRPFGQSGPRRDPRGQELGPARPRRPANQPRRAPGHD